VHDVSTSETLPWMRTARFKAKARAAEQRLEGPQISVAGDATDLDVVEPGESPRRTPARAPPPTRRTSRRRGLADPEAIALRSFDAA
jgi:hypothetical protein